MINIIPKNLFVMMIGALLLTGCGGKFDKNVLNEDATPELSQKQKANFEKYGKKSIRKLNRTEQSEIAEAVMDYLGSVNWLLFAKQLCHGASLRHKDCESRREKCIEDVGKRENEIQEGFEKNKAATRAKIEAFIRTSTLNGEDLIEVFGLLDFGLKFVAKLDCGDSEAQLQAAVKDAEAELIKKYGEERFKRLREAAQKMSK